MGVSFRYTGHGINGEEAYGRINHDRSFDAHISLLNEGTYIPAISLGLRDFIGTGWYSSEYIVGTKSIGNLQFTAGLGFGRLAGRNSFSNPLGILTSKFDRRDGNSAGLAVHWVLSIGFRVKLHHFMDFNTTLPIKLRSHRNTRQTLCLARAHT